ncbi:response regulator [bacterium]|nr:response regulator [bacterium]
MALLFCASGLQASITDSKSLRDHAELAFAGNKAYSYTDVISGTANLDYVKLNTLGDIGFTQEYYWLKVPIHNKSKEQQTFFLETARPIIDSVNLYLQRADQSIEIQFNGDAIPFEQKAVPHRKSIFQFSLDAGETAMAHVEMKSDGESLQVPVILHNTQSLIKATYDEQIFYGLFYGILLLAGILYLFFSFGMKDRTFLYYSLYVFFIALMQFAIDGFAHQYITPDASWLNDRMVLIMAFIAAFFLGKYGEFFLNMKEKLPYMKKTFNVIYIVLAINFGALLLIPQYLPIGYPAANGIGLIILLLLITSVIHLGIKKVPVDNYFKFGISFLAMGFVVFILNNFNSIPHSFFSENGPKFGTGLEVIFLSISMANRIKFLRMQNEENQKLALQRAKDANEMKSSFLSNISHELRTPLNLIMGVTSSLKHREEDKEAKRKLELIQGSSENLLSLINDILNFTEIEKGNQELQISRFNPKPIIDDLAEEFREKAQIKGLFFNHEIKGELPQELEGDEEKLRQILGNLLDNAVKFTESGVINFEVTAKTKAKITSLNFNIADTGTGISDDKMATIYESFTKKSFMDKREFGGLGLGLYLAKTFVDLQNGNISIRNKPKGGVICEVDLDYKFIKGVHKEDQKVSADPMDHPLRVLYVEDNEMNQMVLKMLIEQWDNTSIEIANNGKEGLDILKEKEFDIVLMDLQMPVMDGFEATAAIRSGEVGIDLINIPIIALTADITEQTKKQVLKLGADDYLTKPVKGDLLYERIHTVLEKKLINVR